MGVKISSLPVNALPYTGSEKIPLVQGGETKAGTLSSFVNYLSGALLSDSELSILSGNWQNTYTNVTSNSARWNSTYTTVNASSGNWQNTYTTFRANSANYAVKNTNNNFSTDQTFTSGKITIGTNTVFTHLDTTSIGIGFNAGVDAGTSSIDFEKNIFTGYEAGNFAGYEGIAENNICIGSGAGSSIGANSTGIAQQIIAIGTSAGLEIGKSLPNSGTATDIISIGNNAGISIGSSHPENNGSGNAAYVISIGTEAGVGAGQGGIDGDSNISDVIFIGRRSGYQAVLNNEGSTTTLTGSNIIAIGAESGYTTGSTATSDNNIFIGLSSGFNKQGSRNTFIGDLTNTSPTFMPSLSGCIAIGYGATPTARNTIAVGSASTPLSVIPGKSFTNSLSGLKIMINGVYYTIPLLA